MTMYGKSNFYRRLSPAQREPMKKEYARLCVVYADPTGRIGFAPNRAAMPEDGREIAVGNALAMRLTVERHARRFVGPDATHWYIPTVRRSEGEDDEETASLVAFRKHFG